MSHNWNLQLHRRVLQQRVPISQIDYGTTLKQSCIRGTVLYRPTYKTNNEYNNMKIVMSILCNANESSRNVAHNTIELWFEETWKHLLIDTWKLSKDNVVALWGDGIIIANKSRENNHKLDHPYRILCGGSNMSDITPSIMLLSWVSSTTMNRGFENVSFYQYGSPVVFTSYNNNNSTTTTTNVNSNNNGSATSNNNSNNNTFSVPRKRLRSNGYVYVESYEELTSRRKNDTINIYAYIVGVGTPKPTRNDWITMVDILLPTSLESDTMNDNLHGNNNNNLSVATRPKISAKRILVKLFAPDLDNYNRLNIISKGDILRLHRVKVDVWENKYELVGNLNPRKKGGFSATVIYANNEYVSISTNPSEIDYGIVNDIRNRSYVQPMVNGPTVVTNISMMHHSLTNLGSSRFFLLDAFQVGVKSIKKGLIRGTKFPGSRTFLDQYKKDGNDCILILLVQDGTGMANHGFYANAPKVDTPFDGTVCPIVFHIPLLCEMILAKIKKLIRIVELLHECNNIKTLDDSVRFPYFVLEMLNITRVTNGYFLFNLNSSMIFLNKKDYNVEYLKEKLFRNGGTKDNNSSSSSNNNNNNNNTITSDTSVDTINKASHSSNTNNNHAIISSMTNTTTATMNNTNLNSNNNNNNNSMMMMMPIGVSTAGTNINNNIAITNNDNNSFMINNNNNSENNNVNYSSQNNNLIFYNNGNSTFTNSVGTNGMHLNIFEWGKENSTNALLCTRLGSSMDSKISYTPLKIIIDKCSNDTTPNNDGVYNHRNDIITTFKIRVKVSFLYDHPRNFAKPMDNNGRYEYFFFMKVEDDYGDEIMVLISGENGSNFLSDIEPVDFNTNSESLFQLENRILDIMYYDPQALLDMYVTKAKGKTIKMFGYEGPFYVLSDTYINVKKGWWKK